MNSIKSRTSTDVFFTAHPVFTTAEFDAFLQHRGSPVDSERNGRKTLLHYHAERGRIVPVRRSLYASIPPGKEPGTFPVDSFLIASRITNDSVLAYHTALIFHGIAHSLREERVFLTEGASIRAFRFQGILYRPVSPPAAFGVPEGLKTGVETMDRAGLSVRVTTLERTLVDVLDRPTLVGGWEEVWRSLEGVEVYLDQHFLIDYALHLGNATTIAKLGYFLETNRDRLHVNDQILVELRKHVSRRPHYVERSLRNHARLVKEWNLMIPSALFPSADATDETEEDGLV